MIDVDDISNYTVVYFKLEDMPMVPNMCNPMMWILKCTSQWDLVSSNGRIVGVAFEDPEYALIFKLTYKL